MRGLSARGHRGRRGCWGAVKVVKVIVNRRQSRAGALFKTDILPKHKQGGGQAAGRLLLQGKCSSDDENKPAIKSFAAAQVIPFLKHLIS